MANLKAVIVLAGLFGGAFTLEAAQKVPAQCRKLFRQAKKDPQGSEARWLREISDCAPLVAKLDDYLQKQGLQQSSASQAQTAQITYPHYQGADCSAAGAGEYCSHIVCESAGNCAPVGDTYYGLPAYVYDVPALDYRGAQLISGGAGNMLLLRADGGAISWGWEAAYGEFSLNQSMRNQLASGVKGVYDIGGVSAVLKNDGTLITWGMELIPQEEWSDGPYTPMHERFRLVDPFAHMAAELSSGVDQLLTDTDRLGFYPKGAMALTKDGGVVYLDASDKTFSHRIAGLKASDVQEVRFTDYQPVGRGGGTRSKHAWAILKKDGDVLLWGDPSAGGVIASPQELQNVAKIYSTRQGAFAALKKDGSVVAWGSVENGGVFSSSALKGEKVKEIYANDAAFAALTTGGRVVTWGHHHWGGDTDEIAALLEDVIDVIPSRSFFMFHRRDGAVVTWAGYSTPDTPILLNVKKVVANADDTFFAVKTDGSAEVWGNIHGADGQDVFAPVASKLQSGISKVYPGDQSFAVLKDDGSVVYWGYDSDTDYYYQTLAQRGYLDAKDKNHPKRIVDIITNTSPLSDTFVAVRNDGSMLSWGTHAYPWPNNPPPFYLEALLDEGYDVLDDPVWSQVYPDMYYVEYFGLKARKRN